MQTFLPYESFERSAACLDRRRLGKQRVEVLQIARAIRNGGAWRNHPAVRMWAKSLPALLAYGLTVCLEWRRRGYRDSVYDKLRAIADDLDPNPEAYRWPEWLGDAAFHRSHRSNLVRKDPTHYRRYFPLVADDLPYVWPV